MKQTSLANHPVTRRHFLSGCALSLTGALLGEPQRARSAASSPIQSGSPRPFPFNMTGQPAASVPAGFTRDGLPVGLQIIGRHLDDPMVLRASAAYEAAAPWKDRWPPMLAQMGL